MDRFLDPLWVEHIDRKQRRLLAPFSYLDPVYGRVWVPAGEVTDFASVTPLRDIAVLLLVLGIVAGLFWPPAAALLLALAMFVLSLYASVVGYGAEAATIHDRLYSTAELRRSQADRVFLNALRSSGHARWRTWLMWVGVRIGGARHYGGRNAQD